jgi:glycerophosphoryl diester phosphodiesterase
MRDIRKAVPYMKERSCYRLSQGSINGYELIRSMRIGTSPHCFLVSAAIIMCVILFPCISCSDGQSLPEDLILESTPRPFPFPNPERNDTSNPYRYIAHAGGVYNGLTYTNSREAMDASALKGFKLYELDLIMTSDNEIVAAHDWNYWKTISGYTGDLPPTLSDFMSMPLHGSLSPLTLTDIAVWFSAHEDAVLITDKITDYGKLASEFPFPERLMAEVFTLNGYVHALEAGIRYPLISLEAAHAGYRGEWLRLFINENRIPLAVLGVESTDFFSHEIDLINGHGGFVFAFTSNDPAYLSYHPDLFGIYTDSINFTTMTSEPIRANAPVFDD